jgi:TPR repeat protein
MLMMGRFSDEGRGVPKNQSDAQSWYLKVVNADSEPRMGIYDFPERFADELKLYTEAKIKAQYRYGISLGGNGVTIQSYVEAFEYIALAASMGYTPAYNEIAKIHSLDGDLHAYFEGSLFAPDSFAESDDSPFSKDALGEAMNKLGDTFFDGKSIKKNEAAAARCYRFAAELGNVDAAYSYGWCLRHGVGVHENDAEAVKWLKMAADKGNANAAYSYGLACEEGSSTGVKNKREALYYYRMAASAGHRDAAEHFMRLSDREEQ